MRARADFFVGTTEAPTLSRARLRTRTAHACGFSRSPLHDGHGTASPSSSSSPWRSMSSSCSSAVSRREFTVCFHTSPKPRHSVHQPCGELNENSRGSSSSNDRPQSGHARSVLRIVPRLFSSSTRMVPRPIFSALFTSSASLRLRGPRVSAGVRSPTSTSMVCSRKRSSARNSSTRTRIPSTSSVSKPWRLAHFAMSVWKPLRAFTSVANTRTRPRFASTSTLRVTAAAVCDSTAQLQSGQCCTPSFEKSRRKK